MIKSKTISSDISPDDREFISRDDIRWMQAAIRLGYSHRGLTAPNPHVGAIIVNNQLNGDRVVGSAVTARFGRPHAEPLALELAEEAAQGATLYVTLEPCSHHGHTPPCVDAIINKGLARVVIGCLDPDQRVAGQGARKLQNAGIEVTTGVEQDLALNLHRGHVMRKTQNRPFITLKMATTQDGYIAAKSDERLLITNQLAQNHMHGLRAKSDAILVGAGTVSLDNPSLTCRLAGMEDRSPMRILLDPNRRIPHSAKIFQNTATTPTRNYILNDKHDDHTEKRQDDYTEKRQKGLAYISIKAQNQRSYLQAVLTDLAESGITELMVEGGAKIAKSLAEGGFIDEIALYRSRQNIGDGMLPFVEYGFDTFFSRYQFEAVEAISFDDNLFQRYSKNIITNLSVAV